MAIKWHLYPEKAFFRWKFGGQRVKAPGRHVHVQSGLHTCMYTVVGPSQANFICLSVNTVNVLQGRHLLAKADSSTAGSEAVWHRENYIQF